MTCRYRELLAERHCRVCEKLIHSAAYCVLQDRVTVSPDHLLSWKKRRKNKYLQEVYT